MNYQENGNLEPNIHQMEWDDFVKEFGYNQRRRDLIEGLLLAMEHLGQCGCRTIYVDGSFVTKERNPGDFDACWDNTDEMIDWEILNINYTVLSAGTHEMAKQKYRGTLKPATYGASWDDRYIDFFQKDKYDDSPKGIVKLTININRHDKE